MQLHSIASKISQYPQYIPPVTKNAWIKVCWDYSFDRLKKVKKCFPPAAGIVYPGAEQGLFRHWVGVQWNLHVI
jgi:hypothetical protein